MKQIFSWLTDFKKECPVCGSAGKITCSCNENYELSCPNCHGTGVVSVRKTTSQTYEVPCDFPGCHKGKVSCGICSGTGKQSDGSPCKKCHGSGEVSCSVCGGVGKIKRVKQETWLEHESCHICNGRGLVSCYQCHGTKERVCPECKGTGKVLNVRKIALLAMLAAALIVMPILAAALALPVLGYCLFVLEQRNKQTAASETKQDTENQSIHTKDAKIEFGEIE